MKEPLLVIGGDSFLGQGLCRYWTGQGAQVVATTRRPPKAGSNVLMLDLAADGWQFPDRVRAAVLCAGITAQEACRTQPEATRHINVTQTLKLVRALTDQGCFVAFLSTNLVFDGTRPLRRPDEPTEPRTEYGCQKAEVEAALADTPHLTAIVRLTKVIHRDLALFQRWLGELRAGRVIHPFANYSCAPVPASLAIRAIAQIAEQRAAGLWHLSSTDDVSYAEIGEHFARRLGLSPEAMVQASQAQPGTLEHLPRYTSLDTTKTRAVFGIQALPSLGAVDQVFFDEARADLTRV